MREPRWVPRLVVEAAHLDQSREHGGMRGLSDDAALDAALARPRHKWSFDQATDICTLAAAYAHAIARAHPFNDGNKRVAFITMVVFLGLNGNELDATEAEVVQLMSALAKGSMKEGSLTSWIRKHVEQQ